ncbi:MAG: lytic transglycosylase domain-containing protein [Rhodobacteraceae bacterium]|nr:lytic transglycosylase domain-containing protein [Paracoccaceae bacterium]
MTHSPHTPAPHPVAAFWRVTLCALWGWTSLTTYVTAATRTDESDICIQAAQIASQAEGVPLSVLLAIALNESGRRQDGAFRPWPWTVNMEGTGHWFDSPDQALAYAEQEFTRGATSFDIGCFQINYRWHGQHFASIQAMFDPMANATYAARYLRTLYIEQGSWEKAAGAYHSRTPEFADRYAARFNRFRSTLLAADGQEVPQIPDIVLAAYGTDTPAADFPLPTPRVNNFPLLRAGAGASLGSLVPVANGNGASLFAPPATAPEADQLTTE